MVTPRQQGRVRVQVVSVAAERRFVKDMLVPVGQTVGWCVNASGLAAVQPGAATLKLGIWGKMVKPEAEVAEGDRIEVYMPCSLEAVKKARQMKASGIAKRPDLSDNRE